MARHISNRSILFIRQFFLNFTDMNSLGATQLLCQKLEICPVWFFLSFGLSECATGGSTCFHMVTCFSLCCFWWCNVRVVADEISVSYSDHWALSKRHFFLSWDDGIVKLHHSRCTPQMKIQKVCCDAVDFSVRKSLIPSDACDCLPQNGTDFLRACFQVRQFKHPCGIHNFFNADHHFITVWAAQPFLHNFCSSPITRSFLINSMAQLSKIAMNICFIQC